MDAGVDHVARRERADSELDPAARADPARLAQMPKPAFTLSTVVPGGYP